MSTKLETSGEKLDVAKLILAFIIVGFAMVVFYFYSDQSLLYRVIGLLVATAIALAIALQTAQGRQIKNYFVETQLEVRKIVWPTRQETVQTTIIVVVTVIVVALLLWGVDSLLGWGIGSLLRQGG